MHYDSNECNTDTCMTLQLENMYDNTIVADGIACTGGGTCKAGECEISNTSTNASHSNPSRLYKQILNEVVMLSKDVLFVLNEIEITLK